MSRNYYLEHINLRGPYIVKWNHPTYILYGSNDHLTPRTIVEAFVLNFHCHLDVLQNGEHYFHTKEQLAVVDRWLDLNI